MDMDSEQTLFEITERTDTIEKPKRQATQRQLDALAKARQVRAETKQKENEEEAKLRKQLPAREMPETEPLIVPRLPKTKKKAKPTIIQFQDDSDSDDDADQPVIIIKNKKHKAATPKPEPVQPVPELPKPIEPVQQKPRQFIRKAY